jgi:Protein of unknown function (DUF998)
VRPLMIALNEIPYTLLVLAFAVGIWESAGRTRAGRITSAMLIGYAVTGMVTGVIFPMNTREAIAAGEGTLRNAMHPPGTIVMSLFFVLAVGFGSTLLVRDHPHAHRVWRFDEPAGWPNGGKPTYAMDGA